MQRRRIKVIISGGGTGGHIFPALAIAHALKKENSENEILFVGANGRMEMEKIPAAGFKIEGLNISGIQRKFSWSNLLVPFKVISSVIKAKKIIRQFHPDAAVGVGGYASAPLLYAATSMKIPSLIQEQNSYAGITNKILSKRVQKICVAYEGMERYFPSEKITITGNPVRSDILNIENKKEEALKFFGLSAGRKTILVIGGSLGARTINESMASGISSFRERNIQLIWQTGKMFFSKAQVFMEDKSEPGIRIVDFIQRMDLAYAAADIVISRAGASSVSELSLVSKPAILVPSPNVAEDHQTKNAMALVNRNAAILIHDEEAKEKLVKAAMELLGDEKKQEELKKNIGQMSRKNAAEKIVAEIYSMINITK
ncbi:MAG: undecaprenyldiphospho-muramoylpentapeptide beta-N-acetylglucosaminyltransferase [Bacteroidetes bacterium]|nr:undecaprenyldiphospho-muramoylpentapeptide beta-N-acetylglucosaminyltransferase [Bacteroidota bacterium]